VGTYLGVKAEKRKDRGDLKFHTVKTVNWVMQRKCKRRNTFQ